MHSGLQDTVTPAQVAGAPDRSSSEATARLAQAGQSIWLDAIDRHLIASGELGRLIDAAHVSGLTSNPAIFQKAMAGPDYRADMERLRRGGASALAAYEALAIADVQAAADLFRPLHDRTEGRDGLVSLEVSPALAHDAAGTVVEGRRLWAALGRPNVMIKVPGTAAGVVAVEALIAEGINVNVTLLFACDAFDAVAEAYVRGLERRLAAGQPIDRIASVASFFISRIDTRVDADLDRLAAALVDGGAQAPASEAVDRAAILALRGKAAIANAQRAYARATGRIASPRWARLAAAGARPQRLLWASTSCKNPAYRDVVYVESLVGRETVNTMPPATLAAFVDHGVVGAVLTGEVGEADEIMTRLARVGIDFAALTRQLLDDGLHQFSDAFAALIAVVDQAG
jgi:transaldolase